MLDDAEGEETDDDAAAARGRTGNAVVSMKWRGNPTDAADMDGGSARGEETCNASEATPLLTLPGISSCTGTEENATAPGDS